MPIINRPTELSQKDLLGAIEKLPPEELENFVQKVLALRAQQYSSSLSHKEAELFQMINRSLDDRQVLQYRELVQKRQAETLTQEEHQVLIELSDRIETIHAERMKALLELAHLRQTPLQTLMKDLGISARMQSIE